MSVNGIGQSGPFAAGYPAVGYGTKRTEKNAMGEPFGSRMNHQVQKSQMPGGAFVLHYFDGEDGDHAVSASCGNDYSVTVYEPKDFDPANPVYKVKTWDNDGNTTERMVDISKVDPANCDYIDMYAYFSHASKSGKCSSDFYSFTGAGTIAYGTEGCSYQRLTNKVNWVDAVQEMMQMQDDAGNLQGYLEYKKFFDFLVNGNKETPKTSAKGNFSENYTAVLEGAKRQQDIAQEKTATDYWEREFAQIGAHAPAGVKKAWMEAAEVAGVDGMGISANGKMDHISQLMVLQIERNMRGEYTRDLLGSSVQSAIRAADEALYALEHPLTPHRNTTPEAAKAREREKIFYQEFLSRLQKI